MKVNKNVLICGEKWKVLTSSENKDKVLKDCDGYTDHSVKKIVVDDYTNFTENRPKINLQEDVDDLIKKTMRHELIHAFMFESGITTSSNNTSWAHDESLIEWITVQFPKMIKAMQEVGALNK